MRGLVGIGLFNTTATGPSSLSEMLARADYKNKTLGYWSGGHDICKITRRCNNAQFFDVKDIVDNPDHSATYNNNPASSGGGVSPTSPMTRFPTERFRCS